MDPMDDIVEPAPPELLTVEEASKVMRIGRQLAYDLANDYLASGGTQGLPVIRFGVKCLPRAPLGIARAGVDRQRRAPVRRASLVRGRGWRLNRPVAR